MYFTVTQLHTLPFHFQVWLELYTTTYDILKHAVQFFGLVSNRQIALDPC